MKWFFAGMSAVALLFAVAPEGGLPGWMRMTAAGLSLAFGAASFAIWAIEHGEPA